MQASISFTPKIVKVATKFLHLPVVANLHPEVVFFLILSPVFY